MLAITDDIPNYATIVLLRLTAVVEAGSRVSAKLKQFVVSTDVSANIGADLLLMLDAIDDIVEIVSLADMGRLRFIHLDKPEKNFLEWFGNHAAGCKTSLKLAVHFWQVPLDEVQLKPEVTQTPREWLSSFISVGLNAAMKRANVLFDAIAGGRLRIEPSERLGDFGAPRSQSAAQATAGAFAN